ncbi:MAG: redoxin family protein [Nitrospira sp.]|nr:redoxin family protein [Nitrospira sp.]
MMNTTQKNGMVPRGMFIIFIFTLLGLAIGVDEPSYAVGNDNQPTFTVGDRLPDATLIGFHGKSVRLTDTQSRVKLISIVPQLNTPVCDEQTHHFSEQNAGLDRTVEIITLSTNPSDDQAAFAKKAGISNITFLSDAPSFEFGKRTGLLLPTHRILHRAVIVADADNIIRYVQLVPMGDLPDFAAAYDAARRLAAAR